MRTTKTRLLSLILAVMMLVSMLPTMALAEDIIVKEDSETESSQPTVRTANVTLPDDLPADTVAWNDKDGDGSYAAGEAYTALETALTEVGDDQTIVLVKDYNYSKTSTGSVTIPAASQNVTVNLNGKTLLAKGYAFATASAESSATVTIKNGTLTCKTADKKLFSIGGGSTVTLENMTITNNGATGADGGTTIAFASGSDYAATLNLVNCTVESTNSYAILMQKAVHVLNITNSHITTNRASIPAIASAAAATVNFLDAASTLNYMTSGYAYSTGKGLTVNSCTGYKLVEAIDATTGGYTMSMVAIEAEVEPEAAFGGKDYDTLKKALAAAFEDKGGTVTLKKDVIINNGYYHNTTAETYAIEIKGEDCLEKPLILDLGGNTITTTGTLLRYQECEQDIVIRNGNVDATGAQGAGNLIAIANAGALKLENLTITGHKQYIVRIYGEQANDVTLDHVTVMQAVENEKHRPIVVGADTTTANINVTNGSEIYSSVEAVDIQSGTTSKVYLDATSYLYHKAKAPATGETANLVASDEGYVISTTAEADANGYYTTTIKAAGTMTSKSATLYLDDIVYINFYYAVDNDMTQAEIEANGGMMYWEADKYPGEEEAIYGEANATTMSGLTYNTKKGRYCARTKGIPTAKLSDTLYFRGYVQLADGSYLYSDVMEYGGKAFLTRQIDKFDKSDTLTEIQIAERDLYISMLNLIAEAQTYFDYNTENLANATLSDERKEINWTGELLTEPAAIDENKMIVRDDVFTNRGATISLKENILANYYFGVDKTVKESAQEFGIMFWTEEDYAAATTLDKNSASYVVESFTQGADFENGSGRWTTQYPKGFASGQYEDTVYSCGYLVDSEGAYYYSGLVTYSVEKYCSNMINNGKDEAELCKDLTNYGEKAKAYFALKALQS